MDDFTVGEPKTWLMHCRSLGGEARRHGKPRITPMSMTSREEANAWRYGYDLQVEAQARDDAAHLERVREESLQIELTAVGETFFDLLGQQLGQKITPTPELCTALHEFVQVSMRDRNG